MALNIVLDLFVIITIGYLIGNLKYKGFSLDISAILIVALIAGYYGVTIPEEFKYFGLALFMYAVGLQTGPLFFEAFKKQGVYYNIIAASIILFIFIIILVVSKLVGISKGAIIGIFTGTMSSAPSLAAVLENQHFNLASIFFGLTYPFGIISSVLFVMILPIIFRVDLREEVKRYEEEYLSSYEKILGKNFRITNENFKKNIITRQQFEEMSGCVVERIEKAIPSDKFDILEYGDIVRVIGTEKELENVRVILGDELNEYVEFHDDVKVLRLLVTSKHVVGKKIGELKQLKALSGVITKVRRSGIDIKPNPGLTLMLGDKLYITAPERNEEKITNYIGNNLLLFPAGDFLPISLGIVIGILIGKIPFNLPLFGTFKLSFVGGIFCTSLILGRFGRTGKLVWQLSPHSTTLLKTLGQLIFMATIGANSGKMLVESIKVYGFNAMYISVFSILITLLITALILKNFMKMNFIDIFGIFSGALTSTPTLTMANEVTESDYASISYATTYPFALILTMLLAQLIGVLG